MERLFEIAYIEISKVFKPPSNRQLINIFNYLNLLVKWNKKINLTGVKRKEEIFYHLIMDSFFLASFLEEIGFKSSLTILDIGSGSGIPAIPLKIILENIKFVLIEPKFKKYVFLREAIRLLGLKKIEVKNLKIEELNEKELDIGLITARAFKPAPVVLELAHRLLKPEGRVVCFSGHSYKERTFKVKGFKFDKEKFYKVRDKNRYLWLFSKTDI